MDPIADNHRLLHVALYAIFVGIVGILLQSIVQLSESNTENKIFIAMSLAALVINFVASLWVFSPADNIRHKCRKTMVFKIIFEVTAILSPYLAFYVLLPEWVTWHGFLVLCMVLTLWKSYNTIQFICTWSCHKVAFAVKSIKNKLLFLISICESSTDVDV
ncbi:hypothetical protein R6Q59_032261 [Mikania micrantha]